MHHKINVSSVKVNCETTQKCMLNKEFSGRNWGVNPKDGDAKLLLRRLEQRPWHPLEYTNLYRNNKILL